MLCLLSISSGYYFQVLLIIVRQLFWSSSPGFVNYRGCFSVLADCASDTTYGKKIITDNICLAKFVNSLGNNPVTVSSTEIETEVLNAARQSKIMN